jgi:pimeloyl-ACP methyl ester carboxylesterase
MPQPIMKKAKGAGVQIQLAIWGGEEKPILCVHGLTANCRCWDLIASGLASHYKVMAMDLRGRGLSDHPATGYSVDHHCRDIMALLDDMGMEKTVLMGHSLGALISLVFAAQYPQRVEKLILVDGGGKLSEEQLAKVFVGIKPSLDRLGQVFPSFDSYMAMMKQAPFLRPWNQYLETYFHYEVKEVEGGLRSRVQPGHIQEEILNMRNVDAAQYYQKISRPVLILRATQGMLANDDLVLPEEVAIRMMKEMPNARQGDLEGTNHDTIVFHPNEKRDQTLLDFIKE